MSDYIIREAVRSDAAAFIEFLKKIGGESDNLTFGPEGLPLTVEGEGDYIEGQHAAQKSVSLIAEKDGEIIGDGSLDGAPRRMSHRAELGLSVMQKEWNKGVGSALMEALIQYARDHEIEIIHLDVRADNAPAIHLYEKFGFVKVGELPAMYKIDGAYIDFCSMQLDLR